MSTYEFDLDVLNKLTGTHIDIVNLPNGGIGLSPGIKLILDKGTGNVRDFYDSGNSRRVMTMGGSDALYLDATSLDLLGRHLKNPKGLGGADGKATVFADRYSGADMGVKIQAAITDLGATGGTVIVPPGNHTCSDAGSGYAINMASRVEVRFLHSARLTAAGAFAAFNVPSGITDAKLTDAYIVGNKVAGNTGVLFASGATSFIIRGCYFTNLYCATKCSSWSHAPNNLVKESIAYNCQYGFCLVGLGTRIQDCYARLCNSFGFDIGYYASAHGCYAQDCAYGFVARHSNVLFADCHAYSGTYGFSLGSWYAGLVQTCMGCSSNEDAGGFLITSASTGANYTDVRIINCAGRNNSSYFLRANTDDALKNLRLSVIGCDVRATAGYSFMFYRSLKKLLYATNYLGGRAEYWHPSLDRTGFETAHNYGG